MMKNQVEIITEFGRLVRSRSSEHRRVVEAFAFEDGMAGTIIGKLREELDSLVRVIYLQKIPNRTEQLRLMELTLSGAKWTRPTPNGKLVNITDREMVELADHLYGWTKSVYKFGCAFIHLSSFHDYQDRDPMQDLDPAEKADPLNHLRHYHGGPQEPNPSFQQVVPYLPMAYLKISGNLKQELRSLEQNMGLNSP